MNSEDGEAAVDKFGKGNAIFIKADVSKWEANVRFFKETKEAFGRIDFGGSFSIVLADKEWLQMRELTTLKTLLALLMELQNQISRQSKLISLDQCTQRTSPCTISGPIRPILAGKLL